jgi:4-aminobutyrate aminotransferase-like enzyme
LGGNPVACAAGVATIGVIEQRGLVNHAARLGDYLVERLGSIASQFPDRIVAVRGRGLLVAFDVAPVTTAQAVVDALAARGILVEPPIAASGTVRLAPPLIITAGEIDTFVGTLRAVLMEREA